MGFITIEGVGPGRQNFSSGDVSHSSSGRVLSLALGADGARMYAGTYAGVWRSDDAGRHWRQMVRPQPDVDQADPGNALNAPTIYDLAASPTDPDLLLAAGSDSRFVSSRDGIYRTTDGGETWEWVLAGSIGEIVFSPDDPMLVYAPMGEIFVTNTDTLAAVGISTDAGQNWNVVTFGFRGRHTGIVNIDGSAAFHVAAGPLEASGVRRVYTAGRNELWYSTDGGNTWRFDAGSFHIAGVRQPLSDFQVACQIAAGQNPSPLPAIAGATADNSGSGAHILAVEPGNSARVYLAAQGGANGPGYYNDANDPPDGTPVNTNCKRLADEASLWLGDFSQFDTLGQARWGQLPGPPLYTGTTTPSGNTFVLAKTAGSSLLLFFADNSHVHVSAGTPAAAHSWHRLDGRDLSAEAQAGGHENVVFVHPDPHAISVTPDFNIALKDPSGVSFPYNNNSVLDQHLGGTIWMANDGGVYWSDDGGQSWNPAFGLETLAPINIAGLCGLANVPALYMGCGDNDDFFTVDGGVTWKDPLSQCGDCDAWFADIAQPRRVLEFDPRNLGLNLIRNSLFSAYPDAGSAFSTQAIPPPRNSNASSGFVLRGFRPVIQTMPGEAPLPDGDYVFIGMKADGTRAVLRTTAISKIHAQAHWDDPNKAQQIGAPVPGQADIVQAAGGHASPSFFVADPFKHLWKWDDQAGQWQAIVPGGFPGRFASEMRKFFVDPYNPELIYLVDRNDIKVSLDEGGSWITDAALKKAVTANGLISISGTVIQDMLFVREEPSTRFAFGDAGVFCTINGFEWFPLLDSLAFPGRPICGFFDPVSDPLNRALYVAFSGRSIVRLSPIPAPEIEPPPVYDLMEFAAIIEA